MQLFSERNGYMKPLGIVKGEITPEIRNAISSCYSGLREMFYICSGVAGGEYYSSLDRYVWQKFLNQPKKEYNDRRKNDVMNAFILDEKQEWYRKLDLIEFTLTCLRAYDSEMCYEKKVNELFTDSLNSEFERLKFGYRIINDIVTPITSEEEIKIIEDTLQDSYSSVKAHLAKALEFYSKRPDPDYANSIKESIMMVESYCTGITGVNTLADVIKHLGHNGFIEIHSRLKSALSSLYQYTNQPEITARHANSSADDKFTPQEEEALLMMSCCCAFLNYLKKKIV